MFRRSDALFAYVSFGFANCRCQLIEHGACSLLDVWLGSLMDCIATHVDSRAMDKVTCLHICALVDSSYRRWCFGRPNPSPCPVLVAAEKHKGFPLRPLGHGFCVCSQRQGGSGGTKHLVPIKGKDCVLFTRPLSGDHQTFWGDLFKRLQVMEGRAEGRGFCVLRL